MGECPAPPQETRMRANAKPSRTIVTSGMIPDGLVQDPLREQISGTPTAAGSYAFLVVITDSETPPQSNSTMLTVSVGSGVAAPIRSGTVSLTGLSSLQ
jgi:hypothetical protein